MRSCEQHNLRLMLYRDNELDERERRIIEAHLRSCEACRLVFNRERWLLASVQGARTLYETPEPLRARVMPLVKEACRHLKDDEEAAPRPAPARWARLSQAAAAVLATLLLGSGIWATVAHVEPAARESFAQVAVDVHQRHQDGQLPLEVQSRVSADISKWFENKVPFAVQLPNYQDGSGQRKRYRLEGARLVGFKGDYAAFVAYQMEEHPISLLVTSSSFAAPAGPHHISSKGIDFHYDTIDGLKVITWSHRDLTYALVSDLEERGQQSCLVCHQGARDRDFIQSLSLLREQQVDARPL